MRALAAFLGDSFREAMDRKVLLVLLVLTGIIVLFCFSLSFEADGPEKVLADQAGRLADLYVPHGGPFGMKVHREADDTCAVGEVAGIAGDDWPPDLRGGYRVDLKFKALEDVDRLAEQWQEARANIFDRVKKKLGVVKKSARDTAARLAYLQDRFRFFGYNHVEARELRPGAPEYRVAVRTDYPHEVTGAHHLGIGFGLTRFPLPEMSMAEVVIVLQTVLANIFAGFVGMLVAIVVASSFVPNFLQKGTVDFVLSRPLGRTRLLLYKYLGGVCFISVLASVLIAGCWLAISIRTSFWSPWFLATILTVTGTFAVLYSVAVLFGVLTRSGALSALLSIAVWGVSGLIVGGRQTVRMLVDSGDEKVPAAITKGIDILYAIFPKTKDLDALNTLFLLRSHLSPNALERLRRRMPREAFDIDWGYSLGTTAAFAAVMLALAVWRFRRRDF
jgi:ABC-type transport system involved in multi-copper enzyme maturation permease subunit